MKNKLLSSALAIGTLATGFMMQASPVQAASITCLPAIQTLVSPLDTNNPSLGCEVGSTSNDFVGGPSPAGWSVNQDNFFGVNDWKFLGKDEENFNIGLGNGLSGTWNISGLTFPSDLTDVMLVFKGPNEFNFVGYLVEGTTGNWTSPFNSQQTSHISVYYRNGGVPIPTPALLPGLIGMGVAALRKRQQEDGEQEA